MATKVSATRLYGALLVSVLLAIIEYSATTTALAFADSFTIVNRLDKGQLEVDCGQNGGHARLTRYGERFERAFTASAWRPLQFECAFRWGAKVQRFAVWTDDDGKLEHERHLPCAHCLWSVTQLGFLMSKLEDPAVILAVQPWH